jgi:hypothetical protein
MSRKKGRGGSQCDVGALLLLQLSAPGRRAPGSSPPELDVAIDTIWAE